MTLYPEAVWEPLIGHSETGTLKQRKRIVLHETESSSARSAIWTFKKSLEPHRKSCHFVIDRNADATVYQLLDPADTGWHASDANNDSVGIEHAAMLSPAAMHMTDAQYGSSAKLVAWLCKILSIPLDREHVQTHHEASSVARQQHHICMPGDWADRIVEMAGKVDIP